MKETGRHFKNPIGIVHPKVRWAVIEYLLEQILSQNICVGKSIPIANELCEKIGVSRTVVREGINVLVSKGMLVAKPGEGTFVCPLSSWMLFDPEVLAWLQQSDMAYGIIEHLMEIRMVVEPEAAALAATRGTMEQFMAMREAINRMSTGETLRTPSSTQGDIDFHNLTLEASGNIFLSRFKDLCMASVELIVRLTFESVESVSKSLENHKDLLEAIQARKPDLAREKAKTLLCKTLFDLQEMNIPIRQDTLHYFGGKE